jgi:putative pyruvate formate lyase activating enzyme
MKIQAFNQIAERIQSAKEELSHCNLCPRNCGVNRLAGQKGYCGLDSHGRIFKEMVFCGEETGLNPSHQIHFTGCNLRCEFCVVQEWNEDPLAISGVKIDKIIDLISQRQKEGAKTLNLLGGEISVNLYSALQLLEKINPEIKVVWNSNMFYNDIVDKLISGLIDIYLADLKCGNSECAEKVLGSAEYPMIAKTNILKAFEKADVIVRHVILPGHKKCCLEPILEWLATEAPKIKLSLRGNYVPPIPAIYSPKEYLRREDLQIAYDLAAEMGLRVVK